MMVIGSDTLSDFVLQTRGEVITAVVVGTTVISQHDGATVTYRFALRHDDGIPVYGELHEYDAGGDIKVGDRVTVIEDPDGLVAARRPQDVRPCATSSSSAASPWGSWWLSPRRRSATNVLAAPNSGRSGESGAAEGG